ncbi:MAG: gamma carbonic anhydrase family protein [Candidatus Atribacteria bacterium]|nr:gamma carbonic anhydrase family protein [Candidatus Atribacteria bacterium]MCK4309738.1 gamma carbonic anhydrase family protein [Candidatus Atribacteria bacterium]
MILNFEGKKPIINEKAFVAENANIIGEVIIGEYASIWYNVVLRGDIASIVIGKNTNIQDGSVVHCDMGVSTIIGSNVTVGHNVVLHACKIGDGSLIGIGAIVLDKAEVGEGAIVGAGAIVTPRTKIPPYTMALGIPAKVVRNLTKEEVENLKKHTWGYVELMKKYK